ncbi:hypothetical protein C8R45DRAFT_1205683 [Mycena sanguinolenta]|nr:hypothetical protein C8R45DRAFT_1205683 [Mycena sanguinolenta]
MSGWVAQEIALHSSTWNADATALGSVVYETSFIIGYRDIRPLELESAKFPLLQRAALGCEDEDSGLVFGVAPHFDDLHPLYAPNSLDPYTLPWPRLTKFVGTVLWDMELFTLAPNLTEVTCTFDLNHHASLPMITHPNLLPLTDILQYLTLPALRHLDVSNDEPNRYGHRSHGLLKSFLVRSSPPLLSLSLSLADIDETHDLESHNLDECTRIVGGTLESLKFLTVSSNLVYLIFARLNPDSLPHIQTLRFEGIYGPFDLSTIIYLLHRFDTLRSAAFLWTFSPFLDKTVISHTSTMPHCVDTINGHLSRLAQKGMNIYLGTKEKNYLSINDA